MTESEVAVRPRIVLLADKRNWAFDFIARSIAVRLRDRYDFSIRFAQEDPDLTPDAYDLLYVFFWGERRYERFGVPRDKLIKEVASHRWETEPKFGQLSTEAFVEAYLEDCALVTTPSRSLYDRLAAEREDVYLCPNGIEPSLFYPRRSRTGPLTIGWVGNPNDLSKGLEDVLLPAAESFDFLHSPGTWSRSRVIRFYQEIDVLAIASVAESQPLPLMEAMGCGCFPVTTEVGILPELIETGRNGLVVARDVDAFREAFEWCRDHVEDVRSAGLRNASLIARERSWDDLADRFDAVFRYALARQLGDSEAPPSVPSSPPRLGGGDRPPIVRRRAAELRWQADDAARRLWARAKRGVQAARHTRARLVGRLSRTLSPKTDP